MHILKASLSEAVLGCEWILGFASLHDVLLRSRPGPTVAAPEVPIGLSGAPNADAVPWLAALAPDHHRHQISPSSSEISANCYRAIIIFLLMV